MSVETEVQRLAEEVKTLKAELNSAAEVIINAADASARQETLCRELILENAKLRHALSTARADALEEAALITEKTSIPSFGSDLKWDGYEMALEDVAAAIRAAKGDAA